MTVVLIVLKVRSVVPKYNFDAIREDYLTPHDFIDFVLKSNNLTKFDCDVCCSQDNIPASFRYTKEGLFLDKTGCKVSKNNGLTGTWFAQNWCNPPFSKCEAFIKKAIKEQAKGKTTYMLIPARTETAYWQKYILVDGYALNPNINIKFLKKGLCFLNPETKKPIQMQIKQKNGTYKEADGVYKNALAFLTFRGSK